MANTFTLINSYAATGSVGSISFNSIPSTYTDLLIKFSGRTDYTGASNDGVKISFNGSTTTFTTRFLYGDGSAASSNTSLNYTGGITGANSATSNTFGSGEIYIPNYAGSTNKSVSLDTVNENNATSALAMLSATLWSTTSAITSVTLTPSFGNNWLQYSTAYIYGIKNS